MTEAEELAKARSRFRHFDGMAWPDPHALGELEWRLRYSPDSITRGDQLVLASLVGAYRQMVGDPRAKREHVCSVLRRPSAD